MEIIIYQVHYYYAALISERTIDLLTDYISNVLRHIFNEIFTENIVEKITITSGCVPRACLLRKILGKACSTS